MNLYRQLTDLMKRESRAAAKITASLGGGTWEAETQSGRTVILRGHGETGKRFFLRRLHRPNPRPRPRFGHDGYCRVK